jgi:hypothetical protein
MSEETLTFDIIGKDDASGAFSRVGAAAAGMSASMDIAALQAKVLDDALRHQVSAAKVSESAIASLTRADKILAETVAKPMETVIVTAKAAKALDGLRTTADRMRATFPQFTAVINDAEAKRTLAALAAEAKVTAAAVDKAFGGDGTGRGGTGGIGGKVLGGLFGGAAGGAASGAAGTAATAGGGAGGAGGGTGAVVAGVAGIAAVGSGVAGIIPLLAAATLGVGAFGALALPTITAVTGAVSSLSTDTAAYDAATTKAARNTALAKIKADWAALSPGQAAAVKGIQALQASFGNLATALAPLTLKVLNAGLKAANDLLPALKPLATAAGGALVTLLGQFDKFAQSAGFKAFIANMSKLAGPAILAIGEGFGKVAVAAGKLLIAMESPDALRILNGLFTATAGIINGLAWAFTKATPFIINSFHGWAAAFDQWRHNLAGDVHQVSNVIDGIRVAWVTTGHGIETAWNTTWRNVNAAFNTVKSAILTGVRTLADGVLGFFGTIINGAAKAFGWIPLIGGPLRAAAAQFNTFAAQVNAALGGIQNRTITVTVDMATGTAVGGGGTRLHGARGLYVVQGTGPTADDVLIRASRGELVVPANLVSAGLVDHLKGLIPGFASGGSVASRGAAYLKGWHKSEGTVNAQIDHRTHDLHIDTILAGAAGLSKTLHAKYAKAEAADKKTLAGLTTERTVLRDWRTQLSGSDVSLNAWIAAAGKTPALRENVAGWRRQLAAHKKTINEISAMLGLTGAQLAADAAAAKAAAAASAASAAAVAAASAAGGGAGSTGASAAATVAAAVPLTPAAALALLSPAGSGGIQIPALTGPGGGAGAFPWSGWGGASGSSGSSGWGDWGGGDQGRPGMAGSGGGTGSSGGSQDQLGAKLDRLAAKLDQLIGVTAAVPRATGEHVGAAIGGAAHDASFRRRYG